jgi:hypothetical protein
VIATIAAGSIWLVFKPKNWRVRGLRSLGLDDLPNGVLRTVILQFLPHYHLGTPASENQPEAISSLGARCAAVLLFWQIVQLAYVLSNLRGLGSLRQAQAAQEVLKARVGAEGIQLGVGGDPRRAVCVLVEGFSQP